MSRLSELIQTLPEHLREIAERFLPMFEDIAEQEIEDWVTLVVNGRWEEAYRFAIRKLTMEELIAEQERLNATLAFLNMENAALIEVQREFVRELLMAILTLGIAAVKET